MEDWQVVRRQVGVVDCCDFFEEIAATWSEREKCIFYFTFMYLSEVNSIQVLDSFPGKRGETSLCTLLRLYAIFSLTKEKVVIIMKVGLRVTTVLPGSLRPHKTHKLNKLLLQKKSVSLDILRTNSALLLRRMEQFCSPFWHDSIKLVFS